jgi:DNA ligase-1
MNQVYNWKRSDALLKYKSFFEEDLKVVGVVEGKGKYQGMLGAFVCEGVVEGHKISTEVGSGFDDEMREFFWKNRKNLIGMMVEVKYQGLTDSQDSLRFPIFQKTKEDR